MRGGSFVTIEHCWDQAFKQARMFVEHVSLQTMMETHELIAEVRSYLCSVSL